MLHMFAMALKCFASVSDICFKCFNYFKRMLQVFYLDIAKVDPVLHMLQWDHMPQSPAVAVGALESIQGMSGPCLQVRGKRTRHEC
jgi:hypothetical protein